MRLLLFVCCALLLGSACTSKYLLISVSDLQQVERRLIAQEVQIEMLRARQDAMREVVLEGQRGLASEVTSEIRARVEPPRCPVVPERTCPLDEQASVDIMSGKQLVGAVETVRLSPPGILIDARIDTGATTSSLDAREVTLFERDGRKWVRFTLMGADGEAHVLERKLVRRVRVLQSVTETAERRPVVELHVTVGDIHDKAEFTLTDRSHLDFPVLIGRNVLKDVMLVDVGRDHLAPPADVPSPVLIQEVVE